MPWPRLRARFVGGIGRRRGPREDAVQPPPPPKRWHCSEQIGVSTNSAGISPGTSSSSPVTVCAARAASEVNISTAAHDLSPVPTDRVPDLALLCYDAADRRPDRAERAHYRLADCVHDEGEHDQRRRRGRGPGPAYRDSIDHFAEHAGGDERVPNDRRARSRLAHLRAGRRDDTADGVPTDANTITVTKFEPKPRSAPNTTPITRWRISLSTPSPIITSPKNRLAPLSWRGDVTHACASLNRPDANTLISPAIAQPDHHDRAPKPHRIARQWRCAPSGETVPERAWSPAQTAPAVKPRKSRPSTTNTLALPSLEAASAALTARIRPSRSPPR